MHAKDTAPTSAHSRCSTPAIVLALALLGMLAVGAWLAAAQLAGAPGTTITAPEFQRLASAPEAVPGAVQPAPQGEGPGWETLGTPQKLALYPLAERWAFLSATQKRRWLALAQPFHTLPEAEQTRLHERMTAWASLSAQQRNQARINFAATQRLRPENKLSQWDAYQALSEEEKRKLAARAKSKPQGAATSIQPVAPSKLAKVPAANKAPGDLANPPKVPASSQKPARIAAPGIPAERRAAESPAPAASPAPAPAASSEGTSPSPGANEAPAAAPPPSAGDDSAPANIYLN